MFYVCLMTTTKQKSKAKIRNIKERGSTSPWKLPIYKEREKKVEIHNIQKSKDKTAAVSPYISIITPNINGLNLYVYVVLCYILYIKWYLHITWVGMDDIYFSVITGAMLHGYKKDKSFISDT